MVATIVPSLTKVPPKLSPGPDGKMQVQPRAVPAPDGPPLQIVWPPYFQPTLDDAPTWWTGGSFGLEASVPGTVLILLALILLVRRAANAPRVGSDRR